MSCPRCGAEVVIPATRWCGDCDAMYDAWVRRHASDILWQTGCGAVVAMVIGLGLPLIGIEPIVGIAGVLVGASTFLGLRVWGKGRRRRQFLASSVPRAYLPRKT